MAKSQDVARAIADLGERFNSVTDRQFEWWTTCFNTAITRMGGNKGVAKLLNRPGATSFTTDDKISVSYWYPVSSLSALYGRDHDLRNVPNEGFSGPLIDMGDFSKMCGGGFQKQTLKRYINDLVAVNIIAKEGRGDNTQLQIALPAVNAWMKTQIQWGKSFQPVISEMVRLKLI